MMDMKKIILALTIFSSCSVTDQNHIYIDPVLRPFYQSFLNESRLRGFSFENRDVTMTFKKMDVCGLTVYATSEIFIDSTRFCWYEDPQEVIFHELGHLFLVRSHDNSTVNGRIKSIMCSHAYVISKEMEKYNNYYISELFNPQTKVAPPEPYKTDTLSVNPITEAIKKHSN